MPLPNGLSFLELGWWVLHAVFVLLVYQWGFVRGRGAERRRQRAREIERGGS